MASSLSQALHRTLLLMRDDLVKEIHDRQLLTALTQTTVILAADAEALSTHSAQCAYVTTALLMARSAHSVYLAAPDVPLLRQQPPLRPGPVVASLEDAGRDLLPGVSFSTRLPSGQVDLVVNFGATRSDYPASRVIRVNATAWAGYVSSDTAVSAWRECDWPFGALAAAALAAGEAFKASMLRLRQFAANPTQFEAQFAFSDDARFPLAAGTAPRSSTLGAFDVISAGAISHAALYALSRLPAVTGIARVVENDSTDLTNMNRYALLLRSQLSVPKTDALTDSLAGTIKVLSMPVRYEAGASARVASLARHVLVGVDHIPTRWLVQEANPEWLGIGATTHWSAMASFHERGLGCARCLHPRDDEGSLPIPTTAVVSFWAGLLLAAYFARAVAGDSLEAQEQCVYLTPFRPEAVRRNPVPPRPNCGRCALRP